MAILSVWLQLPLFFNKFVEIADASDNCSLYEESLPFCSHGMGGDVFLYPWGH